MSERYSIGTVQIIKIKEKDGLLLVASDNTVTVLLLIQIASDLRVTVVFSKLWELFGNNRCHLVFE